MLSYIFLGGKCAYCGEKIRIRYFLLEILSGIVFLLYALSLKPNFLSININAIVSFVFMILYIVSLFIIAGIDKERIKVQSSVLIFALVLSISYMTYVCVQDMQSIYTYIIYLILTIILLTSNIIYTRIKQSESYVIGCLMLILYMTVFTGAKLVYFSIIATLLLNALKILLLKIKNKDKENSTKQKIRIPIAFYLSLSNIIFMILNNFLFNWVV